jgi:hypothetical protein
MFVSLNDTVESYSGHVIRIVFYARLNGDCRSIKVSYVVYIH